MTLRTGVLVIGHGTADPVGAAETRQVAATVASLMPDVPVELGFLEVIAPTIGDALARLAARGCREALEQRAEPTRRTAGSRDAA